MTTLRQTRAWGEAWCRMQAQAALRVPSTVVPNESNYFLNPLHPDFKEAKVGEPQNFALDVRLKI